MVGSHVHTFGRDVPALETAYITYIKAPEPHPSDLHGLKKRHCTSVRPYFCINPPPSAAKQASAAWVRQPLPPSPQEISPESVAKGILDSLFAQPLLDRSVLSGLSDLSEFRSGPFARHAGANALSDFWSEFRSSL